MKVGYKKLGLVLGAVAALALMPARADAQFVSYSPIFWSFEASGGVAIPMGDLKDNAGSGASVAIGASYFLNPRFALRADGSIDFLGKASGAPSDPSLQVWHFLGGFEYHIADPTGNLLFAIGAGAGGVTFDTKVFQVQNYPSTGATTTGSFDQTFFAAKGGLKLGYNFARQAQTGTPIASIFINGDFHLMFAKKDKSQIFAAYNGQQPFGTVYAVPITAGIRINVP